MKELNGLKIAHCFIKEHVKEGDIVVDATAGRGNDTVFLASLVGEKGMVYSFDIQEEAVLSTKALVEEKGYADRVSVIHDSHANMKEHLPEKIDAAVFNFGYLPGGDHNLQTKAESSIAAIDTALSLLKKDGIISLVIYYGGDSGFSEKNALMEYLKEIDFKKTTVLVNDFLNRPNCPPIAVHIMKHCE